MPRTSTITPEKFTTFGELLRFLRRKADLTQRELSIAVGYSESQISRMEKNERAPDESTLAARFVTALYIEDELQWIARLLELGAATHAPDSKAETPQPIAEAKSKPHNLPIQLTSFIGREKEIIEIKQLLCERERNIRLLTFTGHGGCGKTRLALQAAVQLLDVFPNGVWLVELAPLVDPSLMPQTVAAVLGVKEESGRSILATLTDHLHGKKSLLILDNCEHIIQASAQLSDALLHTCPEVHILTTSREMLGVAGERVFHVSSLSTPDSHKRMLIEDMMNYEAVRLFVERAATVIPNFILTSENAPAVVQVCQRLDGIPLAIELAAARVATLRIEQIATRLDDAFHLLTSGSRTALPRQQTLRALIDWSYDLLSDQERTLLNRLSVFAGGWTLEAAEAVGADNSIKDTEVLDILTQLVNKSLVLAEREQGKEARYRMLEIIRQYALEKLTASGEADAVRQRHAEYYLAQAQAELFDPEFYRLEQKHDNIRTALAWCLSDTGDVELGLRLAVAVTFGMFPDEARRWVEAALARADMAGVNFTPTRANAVYELGELLARQGYYAAAQTPMVQGLKLFEELGDHKRIAQILNRLGWLAREQGDGTTARAHLEKSLTIYRELDDRTGIASVLVTLAEVHVLNEDIMGTEELINEALTLFRQFGDSYGMGWALNHLGHVAQLRGDFERAMQLHEESLVPFRKAGGGELQVSFIEAFQSMGQTALAQGDAALALKYFTKSLMESQEFGYRIGTAWCLAGLAGVAALNEKPERAAWLWGAAEALRQSIGVRDAPASRKTRERLVAEVRSQLDEDVFNAKWDEGQTTSVEQAIAEALK